MDQSVNIKFRVIHVDAHDVVIRYYTDEVTEDMLATEHEVDSTGAWQIKRNEDGTPTRCQTDYNITIYHENPTEQDIIDIAKQHAPVDWFRLKVKGPNEKLKDFHKLEGAFVHVPFVPQQLITNEDEIKKLLDGVTAF